MISFRNAYVFVFIWSWGIFGHVSFGNCFFCSLLENTFYLVAGCHHISRIVISGTLSLYSRWSFCNAHTPTFSLSLTLPFSASSIFMTAMHFLSCVNCISPNRAIKDNEKYCNITEIMSWPSLSLCLSMSLIRRCLAASTTIIITITTAKQEVYAASSFNHLHTSTSPSMAISICGWAKILTNRT